MITWRAPYTHPMSKRLQVVMSDAEFEEVRRSASERGVTVSEWVRDVLRRTHRERATGDAPRKLAIVRAGRAMSSRRPTSTRCCER